MNSSSRPARSFSAIETLESRIAPASILTYTSSDGDIVRIVSSKGNLAGHATFSDVGEGQHLDLLDLTDPSFAHANILFQVHRAIEGDGKVNVGTIDATGNDLGTVLVRGDLTKINAGDGNHSTPAVKHLVAFSLGTLGVEGDSGASLDPTQLGALTDLLGGLTHTAGGLVETVLQTAQQLLSSPLDASVQRLVSTLVADLNTLVDGTGQGAILNGQGGLTQGVNGLLQRIAGDVDDLLGLPSGSQPAALTSLLHSLQTDTGTVLEVTVNGGLIGGGGILPGLQISLPVLVGLNLGQLSPALSHALSSLGDGLDDLLHLNSSQLGTLPAGLQSALQQVGLDLGGLLGGSDPLSTKVLRGLSNLQSQLASLIQLGDANPDLLDSVVGPLLAQVDDLVRSIFSDTPGDSTTTPPAAIASNFLGGIGRLQVLGDIGDIFLNVGGNLGSAQIRGSLGGGESANGGEIFVTGNLGSLVLGGSIIGGDAVGAGSIQVEGKTGSILSLGSLIGGSEARTGAMTFGGDVGRLQLRGGAIGHDGMFSGNIIVSNGSIGLLGIGSVIGSDSNGAASISVANTLHNLHVRYGLIGDGDHSVNVVAGGMVSNGTGDPAFGAVRILGSVNHATIMGGYSSEMAAMNGSAQIGSVYVRGDWQASSLVAGVDDRSSNGFGNGDDRDISAHVSSVNSRIAAIRIMGAVTGTAEAGDHYGFVAEQIGRIILGKAAIPLHAGPDVLELSQVTGDVTVREVASV